jgi:hypothetical protein
MDYRAKQSSQLPGLSRFGTRLRERPIAPNNPCSIYGMGKFTLILKWRH